MKKTGYVLSGGGARGFAHLGALQYLEELKVKPTAISGTSAGAIVGALYASGQSPEQILRLMKGNNYFGWNTILWGKPGFFSMEVLAKAFQEVIGEDRFEALKVPLFVTATDYNKGEAVTFSTGPLFKAVIASASVPVVFEPVRLDGRTLVDGGLLNNFPIEPLEGLCEVIIGSHVNRIPEQSPEKLQPFQITERCFHLTIAPTVYAKAARCDVFLDPPLYDFQMFDIRKADQIYEIGYQTAREHRDRIENAVFNNK